RHASVAGAIGVRCRPGSARSVGCRGYPRLMSIEVLPATGRWDDFAELLVPKKPGAGGCICMSYRDARLATPARIEYMRDECSREPGPGVLLYEDEEVAGWVSVAPRSTYRRLMNSRTIPRVDERDPWSTVCFVVRAGHRRRGLMHHLLDGAVQHAGAHGADVVEGYPADTRGERTDMVSGYVGTVELFEK